MSKIDELIKRLCPNGVALVALIPMKDVSEIKRGDRITKKDITSDGDYIVMSGGVNPMGRYSNKNRNANTITISSYGAAGYVNYIEEDFWANDVCLSVFPNEEVLNKKYLYYVLKSKQQYIFDNTTKAIPDHIPTRFLEELPIPIPPLEVQSEIVRILDIFTELTAELTAELAFRKKQYEYYKSTLLSDEYLGANCDSVRKMRVDEICNISRGVVISKDYIRDNPGDYPVYSSQTENDGVLGKINSYSYDGEYITWTTDGANAGTVFRRIGKFNITNVCGLLRLHREDVLLDYLYYALSIQAKKYVSSGMGNPKLMSNVMSRIVVSVPSIDLQKRIVSSLNRFNGVCYDVEKGIPAEIGARCKQYEFYRDKLLAFDEVKAA